MERQIITVDISPHRGMVPQLRVSQGDIGRPLGVYIMQDGAALDCSSYSADLYILKSDGNYYVAPATVDSTETNLIIWSTEVQETPVAGECAGQIRIRHGEDDIGTARFVEYVEASPGFSGAGSESAVESIKEYVRQAAASAETASGAASSATGSASAASGSASAAASSASAAAGSASSAHTDAETASQAAQTAQDVADSIPEDYSTLSEDVTGLKSAITEISEMESGTIVSVAWVQGAITTAGADGYSLERIRTGYLNTSDISIVNVPDGYYANIFYYDASNVYQSQIGGWSIGTLTVDSTYPKFRVCVKNSDGTSIATTDGANIVCLTGRIHDIVDRVNKNTKAAAVVGEIDSLQTSELEIVTWEQGGLNSSGEETSGYNRVRTTGYLNTSDYSYIVVPTGMRINVYYYNASEVFVERLGTWATGTIDIAKTNPKMRVIASYSNDAGINPTIASDISFYSGTNHPIVNAVLDITDTTSYAIDANMLKTAVHTEFIGRIKKHQSFCIKSGVWYSADGDGIAKQTDITRSSSDVASLSIGHANAFQLGDDGKGYISGWDDNTIYVINLETMSIESTIALPTTGYTTCAVDTLNKIAYIFQRDSYPDSTVHYNFIVYDYDNEQVLNTRVINAFSAMQACDFIYGKIYVLYGGGTAYNPSGFTVYNTNGDIIGEYHLKVFEDAEPEGVCIDRVSKTIYVSDNATKVYKVYSLE